jgi:hypothetical protein
MYICLVATTLIPIAIRVIVTKKTVLVGAIAATAKNPAKKRKKHPPAKNHPVNRNAAAAKSRRKATPNK